MDTVKNILDKAVREYNNTVFGRNSEFHKRSSYLERRGIFYNCLRRQFQYGSDFKFSDQINVENLSCVFRSDGAIQSFVVNRSPSWASSEECTRILTELKKHSNLEYLDTEIRISFDDIKNFQFKI